MSDLRPGMPPPSSPSEQTSLECNKFMFRFFPSFSGNIFYVYCKFNIKKTKVINNTENCPSVIEDVLMGKYCGGDE